MKTIIAVIATALITAGGTFASTSSNWSHKTDGVWCKNSGGAIACIPMTGEGYGVGISTSAVMIYDLDSRRKVAVRYQP